MEEFQDLSPTVQKAHRYGLATVDMEEAMHYLTAYEQLEIKDSQNGNSEWFDARKGLLCAAIVAYCRPFKKSRSAGFADKRLIADDLVAVRERQTLHTLMESKRDSFIAHADWKARSAEILDATPSSVSWRFPQPNVWEGFEVKAFRRLVEAVYGECLDTALLLAQGTPQSRLA
jgi:hypothetical protein